MYLKIDEDTKFLNKHKNKVDEINTFITNLSNYKKNKVDRIIKPGIIVPKVAWKFQCYIQLVLHRIEDLSISMCNSWNNKRPTTCFILLRAMCENVAVIFDLSTQLDKYLKTDNFTQIDDLIMNRLMSQRIDNNRPYKAINVLTSIDKIDKIFNGFRNIYDTLSEFYHPNHYGIHLMYGKLNYNEKYIEINKTYGVTEEFFLSIYSNFMIILSIFEQSIKEFKSLYPNLISICNKNLNNPSPTQ